MLGTGTWKAVREVFGIGVRGCVFHWSQAVWRHCQDLGLRPSYMQQGAVYRYVRKLMALPFLPAEHISPAFELLKEQATTEKLKELVDYIDNTWIKSTVWPMESWSVFQQSVRTNNDVEGYHRRINSRSGRGNMSFYSLVALLQKESLYINMQMRLLRESKVKRNQRKQVSRVQGRVFAAWAKYETQDYTTSDLLRVCSGIYGPTTL